MLFPNEIFNYLKFTLYFTDEVQLDTKRTFLTVEIFCKLLVSVSGRKPEIILWLLMVNES